MALPPNRTGWKGARLHIRTGYTAILDDLLGKGITNSSVCLERLQSVGFSGGLTTVKDYIASHKHLIPAKRQLVAPQGSRGRRFTTEPGEAYQMDWGFTKVVDYDGSEYNAACFAMVCHHCGQRYVEFFPNDVTWSKRDRYCADQYAPQLEEFPTMPVRTEISRLPEPEPSLSFEKFNFDKEVNWDERYCI